MEIRAITEHLRLVLIEAPHDKPKKIGRGSEPNASCEISIGSKIQPFSRQRN
jgi:hypothetical protein